MCVEHLEVTTANSFRHPDRRPERVDAVMPPAPSYEIETSLSRARIPQHAVR